VLTLKLTLPLTENEGFSPEFIYERARLRALSSKYEFEFDFKEFDFNCFYLNKKSNQIRRKVIMNFLTNHVKILLLTAVLSIGAVWCNNPSNSSGGNIVCKDGEMWLEEGRDVGYIFTQDLALIAVAVDSDGRGNGVQVGTYSTDGNKLTLVYDGETTPIVKTYKVSGGKLTLSASGGKSTVYIKKTGVHIDA
jgi:hypothetical protein